MKMFGDENNQTGEQEYSGLTITELENKLIGEEPESGLMSVLHAVVRWGRLLAVLSLAVIFLSGVFYIQNLKQEIKDLRRELDSKPGGVSQVVPDQPVEGAVVEGAVKEAPPENSRENDEAQAQPVEEDTPTGSEEETGGLDQPLEEAPAGSPQEETDSQSQLD